MEVLGWVIAGILAITTIVFSWLWVQARLKQRAVEETMQDVQQAVGASGPGARGVTNGNFDQDVIYNLLAKGQLNVQGKMHNFGVVGADGHAPQPFLSTVNMTHLVAGDSFSSIRGSLHKVDTGGAAQSAAPAAAPPAAAPPTPAAPVMPAAPEPEEEEDAADRTIMFAPTRGASGAAPVNPFAGFPYLRVTEGPDTGTDFPVPFKESTIGREKSNTIALNDQGSSRVHCKIEFRGHEFVLLDNNSTNGTMCNGDKVTEKSLAFGDSVQVADTMMTFTCDGFEHKDNDPERAIAAFEQSLEIEKNFVLALQNLAFLLERYVARQKEAAPLWQRIMEIDQGN